MSLQKLTIKLSNDPKQLFLIDGLGAVVSAFLLGIVLVQLESYIGMPRNTLYILAIIPCFFVVYDLYCYQKVFKNWNSYVKGIAYMNFGYCVFSMGMLFTHYEQLTNLGWTYFILEILIVFFIATLELKVTTNNKS